MTRRIGRILTLGLLISALFLPALALAGPAPASSREIAACIRDSRCHRIFIVAHRARGFGGPDNSRAAVTLAVAAGVPVVEIDLRGSKDGELFVMHDGKLESSTTLQGRIERLPSNVVASARLRNGEAVPRFRDVYERSRGRFVLSVDFKVHPEAVAEVADWNHAHGSFDDLIFFVKSIEELTAAAKAKKRYPQMIVMARLLDTRVTVETVRTIFGRLPEILHTDRIGADEVARLHAQDVKVYMNAIPLGHYWQPFRYLAMRSLLRTGADFILTDDPEALMRRISSERAP